MKNNNKRIIPVVQYTPTACVYACLEMVCFGRMDQKAIHQQMKKYGDGTERLGEFRQMVRLGLLPVVSQMNELLVGVLMLVTVPSLNIPGGNHRVVIDTRDEHTLYDPNKGREHVKIYSSQMENMHGFSEVTVVVDCLEGGSYVCKRTTTGA